MTRDFGVGGDHTRLATVSLIGTSAITVMLTLAHWKGALVAEGMLLILGDLLQLVTIVLFGFWLHRAYSNIAAFQSETRYPANLAVAFFFLPFVSFFLPQAILQEVWTKSIVADPRARSGTARRSAAPWFETWWYLFVASSASYNYGGALALRPDTGSSRASMFLLAASTLGAIAAFLGVDLMRRVDRHQAAAYLVASLPGFRPALDAVSPRRSALRDLLLPIVSAAENEAEAPDGAPVEAWTATEIAAGAGAATAAAAKTAAAAAATASRIREWLMRRRIPPLRNFDAGSITMVILPTTLQVMAVVQSTFCAYTALSDLARHGNLPLWVFTAFMGPFALVEYGLTAVLWLSWKFWDWSFADDRSLERFARRRRAALIAYATILIGALISPAKATLLAVAAANVFLFFAAGALRGVAISVAWQKPLREATPSRNAADSRQQDPP
jgi:hypothetical protein